MRSGEILILLAAGIFKNVKSAFILFSQGRKSRIHLRIQIERLSSPEEKEVGRNFRKEV